MDLVYMGTEYYLWGFLPTCRFSGQIFRALSAALSLRLVPGPVQASQYSSGLACGGSAHARTHTHTTVIVKSISLIFSFLGLAQLTFH